MKNIKRLYFSFVFIFVLTDVAIACGPEFDSAYLVRRSKEEFLAIPDGSFVFELERISGLKMQVNEDDKGTIHTTDADLVDLREALAKLRLSNKQKAEAISSYQDSRKAIADYMQSQKYENAWYGAGFRKYERDTVSPDIGPALNLSPYVPGEFRAYLEGAVAYHENKFDEAVRKWSDLLSLPKEQRQIKSVWAAFMTGKAYLSSRKQKESIPYFEMARQLAAEGFRDSLGLAQESYGWQALAEYESGDYISSVHHYLKSADINSLNWLCIRIFELKDPVFQQIVEDELSRKVLLGWAVSRARNGFWSGWYTGSSEDTYTNAYNKLLKAISELGVQGVVDNADRIAWIYYNKGDFTKAKEWVELSPERSPLAQYIDVKLMLRDGKIDDAIEKLRQLVTLFEQSEDKDMFYSEDIIRALYSETAVLKLSRKEYLLAFDVLLKGKYWEDIAYMAEKVLASGELEDYLTQHAKDKELNTSSELYNGYYIDMMRYFERHPEDIEWRKEWEAGLSKETVYQDLTYLLARRFAREERWDKAIEYMPVEFEIHYDEKTLGEDGVLTYEQKCEKINPRDKLGSFIQCLEIGQDKTLENQKRAQNYYEAALILRKYGMELMGTELDPDGFDSRGGFASYDSMAQRFALLPNEVRKDLNGWDKETVKELDKRRVQLKKKRGFFDGSADEEKRFFSSLPEPLRRYHYRYKAADLMWKCAKLLPDNDELKAKALCLGGTYLKIRYPKEADKFYKALVRTCGKTDLGKEADKLKWVPKMKGEE